MSHLILTAPTSNPDPVFHSYDGIENKIKETFSSSSNPALLKASANIFHVVMQDPSRNSLRGSASTLSTVDESTPQASNKNHLYALEELGMNGLANTFTFLPQSKPQAASKIIQWISDLVGRIIE